MTKKQIAVDMTPADWAKELLANLPPAQRKTHTLLVAEQIIRKALKFEREWWALRFYWNDFGTPAYLTAGSIPQDMPSRIADAIRRRVREFASA